MSKKINGYARWVTAIIAILVLAFNTLETYDNKVATIALQVTQTALINNEIRHLQESDRRIETKVDAIWEYHLTHK